MSVIRHSYHATRSRRSLISFLFVFIYSAVSADKLNSNSLDIITRYSCQTPGQAQRYPGITADLQPTQNSSPSENTVIALQWGLHSIISLWCPSPPLTPLFSGSTPEVSHPRSSSPSISLNLIKLKNVPVSFAYSTFCQLLAENSQLYRRILWISTIICVHSCSSIATKHASMHL